MEIAEGNFRETHCAVASYVGPERWLLLPPGAESALGITDKVEPFITNQPYPSFTTSNIDRVSGNRRRIFSLMQDNDMLSGCGIF
jgi:hypothetical protein